MRIVVACGATSHRKQTQHNTTTPRSTRRAAWPYSGDSFTNATLLTSSPKRNPQGQIRIFMLPQSNTKTVWPREHTRSKNDSPPIENRFRNVQDVLGVF